MDRFRLDCIKLFNHYPLHQYATLSGQGERQLNVLLLGKSDKINTLLYQILCSGQLPNITLHVTIVCDRAAEMADSFQEKVPAAEQFIRILKNGTLITDPQAPLCGLNFREEVLTGENVTALAAMSKTYSYILVSTGNDALDRKLAAACAAATAGNMRMVAYVKSNAVTADDTGSAGFQIHTSAPARGGAYYHETERIAFNLHEIYEKSGDSRKLPEQIEQSFRDDYNYLSSMEAATHVRAKLACCGIRDTDPDDAARALNRLLRSDPSLRDRLAATEHARWLMTKLLQGYRPTPDVNQIYSAPSVGTHNSKAKWHCCLVPCDMTGEKSRIEAQDWERPFAECRPGLDPLDRMTLQIHEACGKKAEQNRVGIGRMLQTVTLTLYLEEGYSKETLDCQNRLQAAVRQLWAGKKSAVSLFARTLQALRGQIQKDAAEPSFVLESTLRQLEEAVAPLIEFVSRKDYKELDRILVSQLPYVLTKRPDRILAKPISRTLPENLYAARRFAPAQMVYFAIVRNEEDVSSLSLCLDGIQSYLAKHCKKTAPVFHLIAPEALAEAQLAPVQSRGCQVHQTAEISLESIQSCVESIAGQCAIDAVDVTGGNPLLTQALTNWAGKARSGLFYTQKGAFYNQQNAEEFAYERPPLPLTVSEMFDMTGTVFVHNDTKDLSELSELSADYPKLLEVVWNTPQWDAFCKAVTVQHRNAPWRYLAFDRALVNHPDVPIRVTGPMVPAAALLPPLRRLEAKGLIRDLFHRPEPRERCTVGFVLPENIADPSMVKKYLNDLLKAYRPDMDLQVIDYHGTPELVHTNLRISSLVPKQEEGEAFERLIQALKEMGWIKWHIVGQNGGHNFELASREVLSCLERGGNVLERIVYFSALLDGNFDDVEIGWTFLHNAGADAPKNEIDIICTKGLQSLFISVKMASYGPYETHKKYFFNEIVLHAQRFGINAIPVFVTSTIAQSVERNGRKVLSNDAEIALKQGVYLVGRECVQKNKVGKMLERIFVGCYGPVPEDEPVPENESGPQDGTGGFAAAPDLPARETGAAALSDTARQEESPRAACSERDAFLAEIFCGETDSSADGDDSNTAAPDAAAGNAPSGTR